MKDEEFFEVKSPENWKYPEQVIENNKFFDIAGLRISFDDVVNEICIESMDKHKNIIMKPASKGMVYIKREHYGLEEDECIGG